jgi:Uma2 family endonuclease
MYEEYAREYLRSLRPEEHIMEAPAQATQRKITLESLDLVKPHRPDLHVYNELLVQYPRRGKTRPGQVVPDNLIVLSDEEPRLELSYTLTPDAARPFWVLEYISKNNSRKDYEENFEKYERELKVPYYLLFNPEAQELSLYRHNGKKYVSVRPNKHGRCAVRELDMEVVLLDGWVRFCYKGELLPLPADLQRQNDELKSRLAAAEEEVARLRALLEQRNHKGRSS